MKNFRASIYNLILTRQDLIKHEGLILCQPYTSIQPTKKKTLQEGIYKRENKDNLINGERISAYPQ